MGRTKEKESYPTLAYEVTMNHSTRVLGATCAFPGGRNNKAIRRYDPNVMEVRLSKRITDLLECALFDADTDEHIHRGAYLIVERGYHKWKCLVPPYKASRTENQQVWSKHLESVRKDVECCIMKLKGRFCILKLPLEFRSEERLNCMFYSCCILQNMLQTYGGLEWGWWHA
ncbi:unnamed protein product [Discosporangium mesarthrocarpum]